MKWDRKKNKKRKKKKIINNTKKKKNKKGKRISHVINILVLYHTRPIEPIEKSFEQYSGLNVGQSSKDFIVGTMRDAEDANPHDSRRCVTSSSNKQDVVVLLWLWRRIRSYRTRERKYWYLSTPPLPPPSPPSYHLIYV